MDPEANVLPQELRDTPEVTPAIKPVDDAPEPEGALAVEPTASVVDPPSTQGMTGAEEPSASEQASDSGPNALSVTPAPTPPPSSLSAEELADIRAIIVSANPEAVPELIQGSSLAELKASLETARSAYQRIVEGVRSTPVPIPAGQPGRQPEVLPENATPAQRIAAGLRARKAS